MQQLKRVGWQLGQPLLPLHLIAQEDSLLAHLNFHAKNSGIPFFGIGQLQWDNTLLFQGIVSISRLTVIFPSGEIVDVPENGKIPTFDLNKLDKTNVTLYLHLLKDFVDQEMYLDEQEEEKVVFAVYQLALSTETHLLSTRISFKLAEFEKDIENRWKLIENYAPPVLTVNEHPFLQSKLFRIRTIIDNFQKELEQESATGRLFEQKTMQTKLCLIEVAKLRRFLLNLERNILVHPYYLYEQISQFLDTLALIYTDQNELSLIPYQHDKLAALFSKLIEFLIQYLKPKSEKLASLRFEKRENCYVSERLPQELKEFKELFFIVQSVDTRVQLTMEGLKLASYGRLSNVYRFALTGIPLLRLDSAPFNNNFSKYAAIFKVEKDLEWDHALSEGRLAFSLLEIDKELQAFLYWR